MGDFEDAVEEWRSKPVPIGSASDELDELHADLILADTWVADVVIPFLERGVDEPARLDVIAETQRLRDRALELRRLGRIEDKRTADAYRDYASLLTRVYQGFLDRRGIMG